MSAVQAVLNLLHSVATWQSAANGNKSFQVNLVACGDQVANDHYITWYCSQITCKVFYQGLAWRADHCRPQCPHCVSHCVSAPLVKNALHPWLSPNRC